MKALVCAALVAVASPLTAAVVSLDKKDVIPVTAIQATEVLRDYENACDSGCTYFVKDLTQSVAISLGEFEDVVWQKIDAFRSVEQFVVNRVYTDEAGVLHLDSSYPTEEEIAMLEAETGLRHDSAFNSFDIYWSFTTLEDGTTEAMAEMIVDHKLPSLANGIIRNALRGGLEDGFGNFERYIPPIEPELPEEGEKEETPEEGDDQPEEGVEDIPEEGADEDDLEEVEQP